MWEGEKEVVIIIIIIIIIMNRRIKPTSCKERWETT